MNKHKIWKKNKALETVYIDIEKKLINLAFLYPNLWTLKDVDNIIFAKHIKIYRKANYGPYDTSRLFYYVKIYSNSFVISKETFDYISSEIYIEKITNSEEYLYEELRRIGLKND